MNERESELLAAAAQVVGAFEALAIEYFVGGSVASSVFGEPRQTMDADLIARVLARHVEPLVARLSPEFYIEAPTILQAIQNQSSFNLIHLTNMAKVDVFVSWRTPFAQSQFARRKRKTIGESTGLEFFFASAEDTVLAKLEWYRRGGGVSDRQWRDLVSVLKVQGERLDRTYLNDWAARLAVSDLLHRALGDAGLTQ
jgi:hypothetical protein